MELSRNTTKLVENYSNSISWRFCKIKGKKVRFNMDLKSNGRDENVIFI